MNLSSWKGLLHPIHDPIHSKRVPTPYSLGKGCCTLSTNIFTCKGLLSPIQIDRVICIPSTTLSIRTGFPHPIHLERVVVTYPRTFPLGKGGRNPIHNAIYLDRVRLRAMSTLSPTLSSWKGRGAPYPRTYPTLGP